MQYEKKYQRQVYSSQGFTAVGVNPHGLPKIQPDFGVTRLTVFQ